MLANLWHFANPIFTEKDVRRVCPILTLPSFRCLYYLFSVDGLPPYNHSRISAEYKGTLNDERYACTNAFEN